MVNYIILYKKFVEHRVISMMYIYVISMEEILMQHSNATKDFVTNAQDC